MNIKQSNPLTNFYKPTGIPNKINSNADNANSVSDATSVPRVQIRMQREGDNMIAGGWTGKITYELRYAEESTDENPIINVRGWKDNGFGDEFNQTININDIDPRNLTVIELEVLNLHIYGKYPKGTLIDNQQFGSMSTIGAVLDMGEDPTRNMGLNDRFDYIASLEYELAYYKEYGNLPELKVTEEKISNSLDAFLKFEKNGTKNINTISNSIDDFIDDIATSMVDQYSKSSNAKKD